MGFRDIVRGVLRYYAGQYRIFFQKIADNHYDGIHFSLIAVHVSTVVRFESNRWLGKNIVLSTDKKNFRLVVLGFNATLTAKAISWRSVTHMCFLAFSHLPCVQLKENMFFTYCLPKTPNFAVCRSQDDVGLL